MAPELSKNTKELLDTCSSGFQKDEAYTDQKYSLSLTSSASTENAYAQKNSLKNDFTVELCHPQNTIKWDRWFVYKLKNHEKHNLAVPEPTGGLSVNGKNSESKLREILCKEIVDFVQEKKKRQSSLEHIDVRVNTKSFVVSEWYPIEFNIILESAYYHSSSQSKLTTSLVDSQFEEK